MMLPGWCLIQGKYIAWLRGRQMIWRYPPKPAAVFAKFVIWGRARGFGRGRLGMHGAPLGGKGGFLEHFRQGGVGVYGPAQFQGGAFQHTGH